MASWYEDAFDRAREDDEFYRTEFPDVEDLPPLWVEGYGPFTEDEAA